LKSSAKSAIAAVVLVVVSAVGGWWLIQSGPEQAKVDKPQTAPAVEVQELGTGDRPVAIVAFGNVEPARLVSLSPDVSGRVIAVHDKLEPGALVKKGEVLLRIDPADYLIGVQRARAALEAEGASGPEVQHLRATLLLEEAFGYDGAAEAFDQPFLTETLEGVPALARLTSDRVEQLYEAFARTADLDWAFAHRLAAGALFEAAWAEGPEPINPEHALLALESMSGKLADAERPRAPVALKRLLAFLHRAQLVGPLRLERLVKAVDLESAAPAGPPN
jgi:multidrug efflux pump subunit AcrA (membrane-fusion protein)